MFRQFITLALLLGLCLPVTGQSTETPQERNRRLGEAFLAANKEKAGVNVTPSGLQYRVVAEGKGARPTPFSEVTIHYTIRHINYSVIDSSSERGEPMTSPLSGFVAGVGEGLQLMPVGSIYTFYFPAELGYGDNGNASVGPGETLIFEVQLLGITAAPGEKKKRKR